MKRALIFLIFTLFCLSAAHAQDRKPRIGVEADIVTDPVTGAKTAKVSAAYLQAVRDAGGEPVVISALADKPDAVLAKVDGVLFTGGDDLPPSLYGEKAVTSAKLVDPARLAFAQTLAKKALEKGVPVLGVCLGNQLLNVILGGALVQDIPSEVADAEKHRATDEHESGETHHDIAVDETSRLALSTGASLDVNSFHHQAVKRPGRGLRVVAKAKDGVVEAVESEDPARFVVGVQWHPERLARSAAGRRVIDALVAAAKGFASSRSEGISLDVAKVRETAREAGLAKDLAVAKERAARPESKGLVSILARAEERDRRR